jgi:hypothetical protein
MLLLFIVAAVIAAAAVAVRISRQNDTGVSCSLEGLIAVNRSEPVLECGTPLPDLRQTVSQGQTGCSGLRSTPCMHSC